MYAEGNTMKLKFKGIMRNLDKAGRLCIPKEYLRYLGSEYGDTFEIFLCEGGLYIAPCESL